MIKHDLADLFRQNSIHKKFVINYDGGTITNSDMLLEEFSLEESISSEEELRFGSCEASVVKFPISNVFTSLNGKVLDVSMVLNGQEDKPLKIGKYKVKDDIPTVERKRKDITAYDALYDVVNANVADWYNALLPTNDSTVTLREFRYSFFDHFGIEQVDVTLVNDDMIVTKTIQPTELSGSMVANAICELNGCFGHINRDGLMDYVFLKETTEALYPSDDLFPSDESFPEESNYHRYTSSDYPSGGCDYQDYVVQKITGLEIRQEDNSAGVLVGAKENPYVVSDNFLTYGKSTEEMTEIAENMFSVVNTVEYRPFTLNTFRGNPCVEVGDNVRIYTSNQIIDSYVFRRTLTGIQSLYDEFAATGKEYRTAQVNSVQSQITQLKGKTNTLERTAEKTLSKIENLEKNISTEIQQMSDSIAVSIDENGNVVTDLTLDKNGMTFVGNYLVIDTDNFTLDEDGNARLSGEVIAKIFKAWDAVQLMDTGSSFIGDYRTVLSFGSGDDINPIIMGDGQGTIEFNTPSGVFAGNVICNGNYIMSKKIYSSSNLTLQNQVVSAILYESTFRPVSDYKDTLNLGSSSNYWNAIYSKDGSISKSDRNMKHDIKEISEKYEKLFFELKPRLYVFNNGKRTHIGAISQDVEESLEKVGLTPEDFAGFCKDQLTRDVIDKDGNLTEEPVFDENGNPIYIYSLRYEEFIMLIAHMEQKAHKRIDELENTMAEQKSEIDELKNSISFLMEKLGGMDSE